MDHYSEVHPTPEQHSIPAIRSLLRDSFTAEELERFCHDRPAFRFALNQFGPGFSFEEMIEALITQCEKQALMANLLTALREANPRQFERYRDRLLNGGSRQRVVNLRPLDMACTLHDRLLEIQALRQHLANRQVRLVSVVGRAGMGKTALVSYLLEDLEQRGQGVVGGENEQRIDGILYLSARSTGFSLDRIQADVSRMLGEPTASQLANRLAYGDPSPMARVENLLEVLQNGHYLIVLDNMEDYLDPEGHIVEEGFRVFLEQCLTRPSGVRLIATSQTQIAVAETALRVVRTVYLREGLPVGDAAAFMQEMDPQGQLGLKQAPQHELERAAVCTEGIPRALELLASILDHDRALSLSQLLSDERLFGTEVVERLVEEGYRRLGNEERRVMEALAVFDRPMPEDALAYVLRPWFPSLNARTALSRLARGFLVTADRSSGKYSLHTLDRKHAYDQLPDNNETQTYSRRNLEMCAADYYADQRTPPSEWHTITDLDPLLAEFEHRIRAKDYDGAATILQLIDLDFLQQWGHYALLVELWTKVVGQISSPALQSYALGSLGRNFFSFGQIEKARELFEQALEIARTLENRRYEGIWIGNLARVYHRQGQIVEGIGLYQRALDIAREIDNRRGEGTWLGNMGNAYRVLGQFDQAMQLQRQALPLVREVGDRRGESAWLGALGLSYHAAGQFSQAIEIIEEALHIARQVGYRRGEEIGLGRLGSVYYAMNNDDKAASLYAQSLEIARDIGDKRGESYCLLHLGKLALVAGKSSAAVQYSREALAFDIQETSHLAAVALGLSLLCQHDHSAKAAFRRAAEMCRSKLQKTAGLYEERYVLALSLTGWATHEPEWEDKNSRARLLGPAISEYRQALENCSAAGVIQEAWHDLEIIRAAGVEGLEPILELLPTQPNLLRE